MIFVDFQRTAYKWLLLSAKEPKYQVPVANVKLSYSLTKHFVKPISFWDRPYPFIIHINLCPIITQIHFCVINLF